MNICEHYKMKGSQQFVGQNSQQDTTLSALCIIYTKLMEADRMQCFFGFQV